MMTDAREVLFTYETLKLAVDTGMTRNVIAAYGLRMLMGLEYGGGGGGLQVLIV